MLLEKIGTDEKCECARLQGDEFGQALLESALLGPNPSVLHEFSSSSSSSNIRRDTL